MQEIKFINDTDFLLQRNEPNFKIRSSNDAGKFLMEHIQTKTYSFRIIDGETEYTIQKDKNHLWTFGCRNGDLQNPFNPVLAREIDFNDVVKIIYKYRKIINTFFFSKEDYNGKQVIQWQV